MEKKVKQIEFRKDIFKNTVINNDLKKYHDHPLVIKKNERAIETVRKIKNLEALLRSA